MRQFSATVPGLPTCPWRFQKAYWMWTCRYWMQQAMWPRWTPPAWLTWHCQCWISTRSPIWPVTPRWYQVPLTKSAVSLPSISRTVTVIRKASTRQFSVTVPGPPTCPWQFQKAYWMWTCRYWMQQAMWPRWTPPAWLTWHCQCWISTRSPIWPATPRWFQVPLTKSAHW